jgi:hypothetical protein
MSAIIILILTKTFVGVFSWILIIFEQGMYLFCILNSLKNSIQFQYILMSYKTNNECFHSCNNKNISIRWKMESSILGCRLVGMKNSIFHLMKIFLPLPCKHSLFVYYSRWRTFQHELEFENLPSLCQTMFIPSTVLKIKSLY